MTAALPRARASVEAGAIVLADTPKWRRMVRHVAALMVILIALLPVVDAGGGAWADDDALYGLQVYSLRDGQWGRSYQGADFDPKGEWIPIARIGIVAGKFYPYVKHPAYAWLLWQATRLFGTGFGFYAVPILGLVLAAIAAWLLTVEMEPRAGPIAFWLTASSPLFVNAYLLWAHTLSAALATAAILAAVRLLRSGMTVRRVAALCALVSAGVLIRSEMVLFAVAVAMSVAAVFVVRTIRERRTWARVVSAIPARRRQREPLPPRPAALWGSVATISAAISMAVVASVAAEAWLIGRIVSGGASASLANRSTGASFEDRVRAFWTVTFSGSEAHAVSSYPILGTVLCVGALVVAWKAGAPPKQLRPLLLPVAAIAAGLYVFRIVKHPELARGILAAWPALPLGLVAFPWRRAREAEVVLVAIAGLFALAVYATQYEVAGGVEWGGRFLSPVVPALAALVAAGTARNRLSLQPMHGVRHKAAVLAAVVVIAPPFAATCLMRGDNAFHGTRIDAVYGVATQTVVVQGPPDGPHPLQGLPMIGWREQRDHIVFWSRTPNTEPIVEALFDNGYDDITVVHDPNRRMRVAAGITVEDVTPPFLRERNAAVHVLHRTDR